VAQSATDTDSFITAVRFSKSAMSHLEAYARMAMGQKQFQDSVFFLMKR